MRVFTHYSKEDGIRWRTLLQFRTSWEVRGSVVMKNPGSANFISRDYSAVSSPEILNQLRNFDDVEHKDEWYEFDADPTMKCVGELFSEYYGGHLDGVIQIFNLSYIREPDSKKALKTMSDYGRTDEDVRHLVAPVYLGFADWAQNKTHCAAAEKFFERAKELGMHCWNDDFRKNTYIHPLYLMRFGKNNRKCIRARCQFYQNTLSPNIPQNDF